MDQNLLYLEQKTTQTLHDRFSEVLLEQWTQRKVVLKGTKKSMVLRLWNIPRSQGAPQKGSVWSRIGWKSSWRRGVWNFRNKYQHGARFKPAHRAKFSPAHSGRFSPAHSGRFSPAHSGRFSPAHSGRFSPAHSGRFVLAPKSSFSLISKRGALKVQRRRRRRLGPAQTLEGKSVQSRLGVAPRGRGPQSRPGVAPRGRGPQKKAVPSKQQLDAELDQYMALSRVRLDAQLDEYMALAAEGAVSPAEGAVWQ